jgi:hypothetical protein
MKNWKSILAGTVAGLMIAGAITPSIVSALTIPATFSPRFFQDQMVHYWRITLQFPICPNNAATCKLKVGALPYNAAVLRITSVTNTAFNSVTSDGVTLGTTQANANEIMSAALSIHTQGLASGTVLATASSATGNGATQTGADGGFDLWLAYTSAGGVASAGNAAVVVEYVSPNDWGCTQVPMGQTAIGC